jgi:hypothetical protein
MQTRVLLGKEVDDWGVPSLAYQVAFVNENLGLLATRQITNGKQGLRCGQRPNGRR